MAQQIFVDDKALAPSSLVAGCKKRATQSSAKRSSQTVKVIYEQRQSDNGSLRRGWPPPEARGGESLQTIRSIGRPIQTDPLNSYDRRIVHNAFKDDPEIGTWSPPDDARVKRITLRPRKNAR